MQALGSAIFASLLLTVMSHYFFTAKECTMVVYDEIGSKAMSQKLEAKIKGRASLTKY